MYEEGYGRYFEFSCILVGTDSSSQLPGSAALGSPGSPHSRSPRPTISRRLLAHPLISAMSDVLEEPCLRYVSIPLIASESFFASAQSDMRATQQTRSGLTSACLHSPQSLLDLKFTMSAITASVILLLVNGRYISMIIIVKGVRNVREH